VARPSAISPEATPRMIQRARPDRGSRALAWLMALNRMRRHAGQPANQKAPHRRVVIAIAVAPTIPARPARSAPSILVGGGVLGGEGIIRFGICRQSVGRIDISSAVKERISYNHAPFAATDRIAASRWRPRDCGECLAVAAASVTGRWPARPVGGVSVISVGQERMGAKPPCAVAMIRSVPDQGRCFQHTRRRHSLADQQTERTGCRLQRGCVPWCALVGHAFGLCMKCWSLPPASTPAHDRTQQRLAVDTRAPVKAIHGRVSFRAARQGQRDRPVSARPLASMR